MSEWICRNHGKVGQWALRKFHHADEALAFCTECDTMLYHESVDLRDLLEWNAPHGFIKQWLDTFKFFPYEHVPRKRIYEVIERCHPDRRKAWREFLAENQVPDLDWIRQQEISKKEDKNKPYNLVEELQKTTDAHIEAWLEKYEYLKKETPMKPKTTISFQGLLAHGADREALIIWLRYFEEKGAVEIEKVYAKMDELNSTGERVILPCWYEWLEKHGWARPAAPVKEWSPRPISILLINAEEKAARNLDFDALIKIPQMQARNIADLRYRPAFGLVDGLNRLESERQQRYYIAFIGLCVQFVQELAEHQGGDLFNAYMGLGYEEFVDFLAKRAREQVDSE